MAADALSGSIVKVTGPATGEEPFGTGFVCAVADNCAYVVTCQHVIDDILATAAEDAPRADDLLQVAEQPADILATSCARLDLAVLRVPGLIGCDALPLKAASSGELPFSTRGFFWFAADRGAGIADRGLDGRLGAVNGLDPCPVADDPNRERHRVWEYHIENADDDWFATVKDGYSGAPVVADGHVVAVINTRIGSDKGYAMDIRELARVQWRCPDAERERVLAPLLSTPRQAFAVPAGADTEPPSESPAPDPAFRAALEQALHRELHEPRLEPLRVGLAGLLECPEKDCAGALCTEDAEMAVEYIAAAFRACRKALAADALAPLRTGARRLMGWRLTALALQDWSRTPPDRVAADMSVRLVVGSTAAAEVLWARWSSGADAPEFRIVAVGTEERVLGARDLAHEVRLPELGWEDHRAYVDAAKAALWERLIGGAPPQRFDAAADQRLKKAFLRDSRIYSLGIRDLPRGTQVAQHYLTVEEQDIRNPLLHPGVLDDLRRELGLPLLFIEQVPERPALAVPDTELQDLIRQVHKLLDDIDAP
jgi:hypothetical protein